MSENNIKDCINIPKDLLDDAVLKGIEKGRSEKKLKKNNKFTYKKVSVIAISVLGISILTPIVSKAFTDIKSYIQDTMKQNYNETIIKEFDKHENSLNLVAKNDKATITLIDAIIDDNMFVCNFIIESDFFKDYRDEDDRFYWSINSRIKIEDGEDSLGANIKKIDENKVLVTGSTNVSNMNVKDITKINLKVTSYSKHNKEWKKTKGDEEIHGKWNFNFELKKSNKSKEVRVDKSVDIKDEKLGIDSVYMSDFVNTVNISGISKSTRPGTVVWAQFKIVDDKGNYILNAPIGGSIEDEKYTTKVEIQEDLLNTKYLDITPYWDREYIMRKKEGMDIQVLTTSGDSESQREEIKISRPITKKELRKDVKPYGKYKLKNIHYFLNIDKARKFMTIEELIGQEIKISNSSTVVIHDINIKDNKTNIYFKVKGDSVPSRIVLFDEKMNDTYSGDYAHIGHIDSSDDISGNSSSGIFKFAIDKIDKSKKYKIAFPMEKDIKLNNDYAIRVNLK